MNLIEKQLEEAVRNGGSYVEFAVMEDHIAFTSDAGVRKSTRNFRRTKAEIRADEKALKAITDQNLLFAGSLSRIEITLSDKRTARFSKVQEGQICTVSARRASETKEKSCSYALFLSEQDPCTGLAFALKPMKNKKAQIAPCGGGIMIGANASGIESDLQILVSGAFSPADGGLQKLTMTKETEKELSDLMESALNTLLASDLAGMPLFSVLPSTMDEESPLTDCLIAGIRRACGHFPLFRSRKGTKEMPERVAYGTEEVTALFPSELAEEILGGRSWIEPCRAGSREEYFLIDAGIPYYDRECFLRRLFQEENLDACSRILEGQKDKWLREFYSFCAEPVQEESSRHLILSGFKNIRSIRDLRGNMRFPHELCLDTGAEPVSKKALIIRPELISPAGLDDSFSDQLRDFFMNGLGIRAYSQKPDMEELADSMRTKRQAIDQTYAQKLLLLAEYDESHPEEIDFSSYAIFPCESARGLQRVPAKELVIGKPYLKEGSLLASATKRKPIWKGLMELLPEEELSKVLDFAERSGAIGLSHIVRQKAQMHRDYERSLYAEGKQGNRDSNADYTIPGLEDILKRRSQQLSRLIWNLLLKEGTEEVLHAEYSVGNRRRVNRCDSTLILLLRERTWVPGRDGKFYMPENISAPDIQEELPFQRNHPVLKALNFGSGIKRREKALRDMEKLAQQEGLMLVPQEEYREFLRWKNRQLP